MEKGYPYTANAHYIEVHLLQLHSFKRFLNIYSSIVDFPLCLWMHCYIYIYIHTFHECQSAYKSGGGIIHNEGSADNSVGDIQRLEM